MTVENEKLLKVIAGLRRTGAQVRSQHDRLAVGHGVGDAVPLWHSGDCVHRPLGDPEAASDGRGNRRL